MYYEELRGAIREGKLAPVYIFEGPEEYLIEYSIGEIKKKIIEPWAEMMNFKSYSELPPVSEAVDFIETLPVMSERKMVVFRKCGIFGNIKNKAEWEKLLTSEGDYNCIIIWEQEEKKKKPTAMRSAVEKTAVVVNFPLRTESSLRAWVEKIAAASGKTIDARCSSYLIASLERKMNAIKTELEKIIAFTKGTQITREDIDSVIVKPAVENVFNLIDAIFEGRREMCFNLLYTLRKQKQEPVALLSLLSGQLINIYKAKLYLLDGVTPGRVAAELGGGYGAEKSVKKAEKIKVENIERLISLCCECDKNIKMGKIGAWAALETIIAEYRFY